MAVVGFDGKKRCFGGQEGKEFYAAYHDQEWGKPIYDDRKLFELLILEGAQAGLSWETVLKKREAYRKAFYNFEPEKVSKMTDQELFDLMLNDGLIRNRLKIFSARQNALAYLQIQKEFGSFSTYLWNYVEGKPIKNKWNSLKEIPAKNILSDRISKDLKKRGMNFVGSTIIYAYMQAVGMVNDHVTDCWCFGLDAFAPIG